MGGGLMQLIAIGAQDVFLTGNPQMTFFKVVYRRYTNFSKECILQDFSSSNNLAHCTLARNGDLVQEIYLKLTYSITDKNQIINSTNEGKITVTNISDFNKEDEVYFDNDIREGSTIKYIKQTSVFIKDIITTVTPNEIELKTADGTAIFTTTLNYPSGTKIYKLNKNFNDKDLSNLIDFIEIEIGGQKIDKHDSHWLDIYNELFEKNHDYRIALNKGLNNIAKTDDIYIPLRFWFNRNAGLALPLISLQYNEVRLNLNIKTITDITIHNKVLLVNYIYLDTDERRRFGQVSHEYLIEQVQSTQEVLEINSSHIDLTFNHPIKSLFWTTDGKGYIKKGKLQLNGHDRFQELDADYFHLIQPYECLLGHSYKMCINELDLNKNRKWINHPSRCSKETPLGMYSFCLKPLEHQPSGTCNFSRIDNCRLNYLGEGNKDTLYLYALNYNVLRIMNGMGGLVYSN